MIDLDELERLDREATPGPWEWNGIAIEAGRTDVLAPGESNSFGYGTIHIAEEDQHLIAAARNALPDLLAELRTLRARVAELERDTQLGAAVREAVIYGAAWAENARFYSAKISDPVECATAASEAAEKAVEFWRAAQKGGSDE